MRFLPPYVVIMVMVMALGVGIIQCEQNVVHKKNSVFSSKERNLLVMGNILRKIEKLSHHQAKCNKQDTSLKYKNLLTAVQNTQSSIELLAKSTADAISKLQQTVMEYTAGSSHKDENVQEDELEKEQEEMAEEEKVEEKEEGEKAEEEFTNYCRIEESWIPKPYILEAGRAIRLYKNGDRDCSVLCVCEWNINTFCQTVPCIPERQCETPFSVFNHNSLAYQAGRGRCICYSGDFICERPPSAESSEDSQTMGLFLMLGFSHIEEAMIKNVTFLDANDSLSQLQTLLRLTLNSMINGSCTFELIQQTSDNLVLRVHKVGTKLNNSSTIFMWKQERDLCEPAIQKVADMINNRHEDIQNDILMSLFLLAEVVDTLPRTEAYNSSEGEEDKGEQRGRENSSLRLGEQHTQEEQNQIGFHAWNWREKADVHEVSFSKSGTIVNATDSFPGYGPSRAVTYGMDFWHSGGLPTLTVPKSLWFEFPNKIRVVKYSFKSRTSGGESPSGDWLIAADGPSKYIFWASNSEDCSDETKWAKLYEDNSGTPFDRNNTPKTVSLQNSSFYRCYGFQVTDVPGRDRKTFWSDSKVGDKRVTISNVHFYTTDVV